MATHSITIGGTPVSVQVGWSIQATANGRNTLSCEILSADGSYRPALDAEVIFWETVNISNVSFGADYATITTAEAHGIEYSSGLTPAKTQRVVIAGNTSTPDVDGTREATRTSATEFTVPITVGDDPIGVGDGTVSRRLFGGTVFQRAEAGLANYGTVAIKVRLSCVDYNVQAERRYIKEEPLAADKLGHQLSYLATNYSFTLNAGQVDGPDISDIPCDYTALKDLLDKYTTLTGYNWEWDEWNELRMDEPNKIKCPVNVIDGNDVAVGDITVEPTRINYANRVILRFSAAAIYADSYLTFDDPTKNFANAETITLGGQVYNMRAGSFSDTPGYVLIGTNVEESLSNLASAIRKDPAGSGIVYAASTTVNSSAEAGWNNTDTMRAVAKVAGAAGNSVTCTTTAVWAHWTSPTLVNGADRSLTNVSIANDLTEQGLHGIWEVVVNAEDTTDQTSADTLSAAYLATKTPMPNKVTYDTYALGIRPGQTQTITVSSRDVDGTFLITEVVHKHLSGNRIIRRVTAIESLLVQAVKRWRDLYKQWSNGGLSSGGSTLSGSSSGGGGNLVGIVGFGGSQTEWQQTSAGAWIAANSIQVYIDTAARGSVAGTMWVRLRASAGSVTARLRDMDSGTTVGTSSAVTSTSFVTVSFAVTLTAGKKLYEVQLSPELANTDVQLGSAFLE